MHASLREQKHHQTGNMNDDDTDNAASVSAARKDFSREVSLFELELIKLIMYEQKLERQIATNELAGQQTVAEIEAMKQRADTTRQEADLARKTQSCLQQYEALAKLINTHHPQSQSELHQKHEKTLAEVSSVQSEIDRLASKIKVREAQYTLLMQYMLDLKTDIAIEKEQEAQKHEGRGGNQNQHHHKNDNGATPMDVDG